MPSIAPGMTMSRHHQIEGNALLQMAQRLGGVLRAHHPIADLLKQRGGDFRNLTAVLHHKNRALRRRVFVHVNFACRLFGFGLRARQIDGDDAALALFARHRHRAAALVGEAVHLRQAQARCPCRPAWW